MSLWDTVEFAHMTLRLSPEIVHSAGMILLVGKCLRMIDLEVMEVTEVMEVMEVMEV